MAEQERVVTCSVKMSEKEWEAMCSTLQNEGFLSGHESDDEKLSTLLTYGLPWELDQMKVTVEREW